MKSRLLPKAWGNLSLSLLPSDLSWHHATENLFAISSPFAIFQS